MSPQGALHPRHLAQEAIVKALYAELAKGTEVSLIAIQGAASILFQNELKTAETTLKFNDIVDHSAKQESTDFYGSLAKAKAVIQASLVPTSSTAVIICSDGEDNVSRLSPAAADTKLKGLIDALAEGETGIPAGTFVCFNNPKNSQDQLHVANMRSLGQRFKQPVISVADGPLQDAVVKTVVDELLQIIPAVNAMHVYMEPFDTIGNEVKRSFADGSEAKYLGLISPGSTKMGQPLLASFREFEKTPKPRFLLLQGEVRQELYTDVVEVADGLEADDLLYTTAKNLLDYQLSHAPRPTEVSKSEIETTIRPLIAGLMVSPRKDALEGEIAFYLDQPEPVPARAGAGTGSTGATPQEFVGDVPTLTLADIDCPGVAKYNLTFKIMGQGLVSLVVPENTTVLQVKQVLQSPGYLGVAADRIKILLRGQAMRHDSTFIEASKETVIHLIIRTPEQVETARKAQAKALAAEEAAARVSAGWTADPEHLKTISIILPGGERLGVEISRTTTVSELLNQIMTLKGVAPEDCLISLHNCHGSPAFSKTAKVSSLPSALTEGFFCKLLPRPAAQSLYSFVVSLSSGEKMSVSIPGSGEPTVGMLKQAIGEKLQAKGFRVTRPLEEINLVIGGRVVRDDTLPFRDIPDIRLATSVHVVHRCPRITRDDEFVLVTRDGVLETARETDRSHSTLSLILAGGETREVQASRDQSLLHILAQVLGIADPTKVPVDAILRAVTTGMSSTDLDLTATLADLRIGPNATFVLESSHALAAIREFFPTFEERPTLPLARTAGGRVLALMDDATRTAAAVAGGGSAGAGGPGSSSRDALIVAFVSAFGQKYAENAGRLRMTFGAKFLTELAKLRSDQDRYASITSHANTDPTSTTATAVRQLLAETKYTELKGDFKALG
jgi:hypothetical protein